VSTPEVERLENDVSLQRIAEARGIALTGRGSTLTGTCPFHVKAKPDITIDTKANTWSCKGCRVKDGSVISFTMKAEAISRKHAIELLRSDHGGATPGRLVSNSTSKKLPDVIVSTADDATLLTQVATYYTDSLKRNEKALAFLQANGITSGEVIDTFGIGLSDRTLGYRLPKANRKAGAEIRSRLMRLGIVRETGHEVLRGCITIPVTHENGMIVSVYGRRLQVDTRKTESPDVYVGVRGCFNPAAFTASNDIVITGTPFEAVILWCAGFRNVTSLMGLDGPPGDLVTRIVQNGVTRIVLVFPRTREGDTAVTRLVSKVGTMKVEVLKALLPKGMDVVSFATTAGNTSEKIGGLIRAAEWIGGTKPAISKVDPAVSTLITERSSETREPPASSEASPAGEVTIEIGDRKWRIRGLSKNLSYESMKVNAFVTRETKDPRTSGFHVDTIELYAARQRTHFITEAAEELGLAPEVLKRDIGHVLLRLEAIQDETIRAALAPKEFVPMMADADRESALALLRDPRLLERVGADFEQAGVVGEKANLMIGYLAATSRKLRDPLAVLIQSSSAAGKSSLMDSVLSFMPEEERIEFSAMTGQALYYMEGGALRNKVLAISEETGAARASYALKLLQSAGSLTIASTAKEAGTGRMTTHEYKVEGPVALMMTTTAIDLDPELANRCIVLSVDEGAGQTRAIHARQREAETLRGLLARRDRARVLALHRNAQRLLLPMMVVNPFASEMTFADVSTRARRDHRKLLTLVRAVTLLHQYQRPKKAIDHEGGSIEYIEVTRADIETATKLATGVIGSNPDDLPPHTRVVLAGITQMVLTAASEAGIEPHDYRFTRREAREKLGMGGTQLWVHVRRLVDAEFLLVHPSRHGRGVVYELAFVTPGSVSTTASVRGETATVRGAFEGHSGHVRGDETTPSKPDSAGEGRDRSGSNGSRHTGSPRKDRRTSGSRSNGAAL
jgi:hypothetical protein